MSTIYNQSLISDSLLNNKYENNDNYPKLENQENLSKNDSKAFLPFIYEDNQQHSTYLRKTKEIVIDTLKFNKYYEGYKRSINVKRFLMPSIKPNLEMPQLSGIDVLSSRLDVSVKMNESMSMKDSVNIYTYSNYFSLLILGLIRNQLTQQVLC